MLVLGTRSSRLDLRYHHTSHVLQACLELEGLGFPASRGQVSLAAFCSDLASPAQFAGKEVGDESDLDNMLVALLWHYLSFNCAPTLALVYGALDAHIEHPYLQTMSFDHASK